MPWASVSLNQTLATAENRNGARRSVGRPVARSMGPPTSAAGDLRAGPVAVVVVDAVAAVGDDELEGGLAGDVDGEGLGRARGGREPGVGELGPVGEDLEVDRAVR